MQITKTYALVLILASALLAWAIANIGVRYEKLEMAAIANQFFPPICGLASLLLLAIIDYFFKTARVVVTILLILINLGVGIAIRISTESIR
jgi:hypothetical protein